MLNDDLSHEVVAVDIEDAIRMNADCIAVQTFIGADGQLSSIDNLSKCINAGMRYSIPTLGVVAVGKQMERTDRFFKLATDKEKNERTIVVPWFSDSHSPLFPALFGRLGLRLQKP